MKNKFKIYVPNKEISEQVQKKLFSLGKKWVSLDENLAQDLRFLESKYLFVWYNRITRCVWDDRNYFENHKNPEVSWQEVLYGEGVYFKHPCSDLIYYWVEKDNMVYWQDKYKKFNKIRFDTDHFGSSWIKCDMYGNILDNNKKEESTMEKKDLKNGMVLVNRLGTKYLYLDGKLLATDDFFYLKDLTDDLQDVDGETKFDIVEIKSPKEKSYRLFDEKLHSTIWKREEVKEVTMADLEVLFGTKVKIVKG